MKRGPIEKARKRASAEERKEARANLSPDQQLKRLDALLGKGEGAEKERARLESLQADK